MNGYDVGWQHFHHHVRRAHEILQPLMNDPQTPPEVFSVLFEVAKAGSWEGTEFQPHLERFLEGHPEYFTPHRSIAEKMLPRWGGQPRDSVQYAELVAKRLGGDAGEFVYARIALHLFRFHDRTQFWELTGFDYERVQRALEQQLKRHPTDSYPASEGLVLAELKKDTSRLDFYRNHMEHHGLAPHATLFFQASNFEFPLNSPLKGRN